MQLHSIDTLAKTSRAQRPASLRKEQNRMNTHLKNLFALAWSSPGVWRLFSPAPPLASTVPSAPTAHGQPGRQHGAALRNWW